MSCLLVTGGARSGKSAYAQRLGEASGERVLFVATALAGDAEMARRIEGHRAGRPRYWRTLEAPEEVARRIAEDVGESGLVIVDCITLLVSNLIMRHTDDAGEPADAAAAERDVIREAEELLECARRVSADFIVVTNEVGLGIVPANAVSRLYRDLLGKANQRLAGAADEVILMVSGLPVSIKPGGRTGT